MHIKEQDIRDRVGNACIFGLLHCFINFVSSLVPFITVFYIGTSCILLKCGLTAR